MAARVFRQARWALSPHSRCTPHRRTGVRTAWGLPSTEHKATTLTSEHGIRTTAPNAESAVQKAVPSTPLRTETDGDARRAKATTSEPSADESKIAGRTAQQLQIPSQEAFYGRYLSATRDADIWEHPGNWIKSVKDADIDRILSPQLKTDPLHIFTEGTSDIELIQTCLELFVKSHHDSSTPRAVLRSSYMDQRPGSRALLWLLQRRAEIDLTLHPRLIFSLAHCLVAEQSTEDAWQWKSIHYTAPLIAQLPLRARTSWRGDLLRCLVEAQAYWGDPAEGIDPAIRTFIRAVVEDKDRAGYSSDLYTPKVRAGVWIVKQLLYRRTIPVSPKLFNTLVTMLPTYMKDRSDLEFNTVRLHMRHPTKPDAIPALDFLSRYAEPQNRTIFLRDIFEPKDVRAAALTFWFLIETAQRLHKTGYRDQARWVLDFGKHIMPSYFDMESSHKYYGMTAKAAVRFDTGSTTSVDDKGYRTLDERAQARVRDMEGFSRF